MVEPIIFLEEKQVIKISRLFPYSPISGKISPALSSSPLWGKFPPFINIFNHISLSDANCNILNLQEKMP
jgi:hypothetical protein